MPRRRTAPKRAGRSTGPRALDRIWQVGADGADDFPLDDLPPDDLPVRDVAEEQDEQEPAHQDGITAAAERFSRGAIDPTACVQGLTTNADEPIGDAPESENQAPNTAQPCELEPEAPQPACQPHVAELQEAQAILPGLDLEHPADGQSDLSKPTLTPSRRPRTVSARQALRAAQLDLWPDG